MDRALHLRYIYIFNIHSGVLFRHTTESAAKCSRSSIFLTHLASAIDCYSVTCSVHEYCTKTLARLYSQFIFCFSNGQLEPSTDLSQKRDARRVVQNGLLRVYLVISFTQFYLNHQSSTPSESPMWRQQNF
jgi:hypothetical protein